MVLFPLGSAPVSGCRRCAAREGTEGPGLSSSLADDDRLRRAPYGRKHAPFAVTEEAKMGLMFRPRRPLMRVAAGAATATVAYKAGQRRNQQNQPTDQAQAPQAAPAAPADSTAELERLAKLHESGALNDEEFAA